MKTKIFLIICFLIASAGLKAQGDVKVPSDVQKSVNETNDQLSGKTGLGGLMSQLVDNLKDEALTGDLRENKREFSNTVNNTAEPGDLSSALQKLQNGISPSAMSSGWQAVKDKWITDASTANTISQVAGLLKQLESNILPNYFDSKWQTVKPAWDATLSAVAE